MKLPRPVGDEARISKNFCFFRPLGARQIPTFLHPSSFTLQTSLVKQFMTHTKPTRPRRQGRIFPEFTIPPEELARREAEKKARCQKARSFFEQVAPQLIDDHYNWFIIIEPNSGDYFIDPDEEVAYQKARQKYPSGWVVIFRLNETGTCGKI
jgi:hypothetical protein